jgi:hypothetical protein
VYNKNDYICYFTCSFSRHTLQELYRIIIPLLLSQTSPRCRIYTLRDVTSASALPPPVTLFPQRNLLPSALRNAIFHDGPRPLPGFDTSTFTCSLDYSYRTYLQGDTRNYVSIPCLDHSYSHCTHLHGGTTPSYVMLKNESNARARIRSTRPPS